MKFPCTLKNALLIIRDCFVLSFASKGLGYLAALLLLLSLLACYKLSCYQTTPLLTISALPDTTLLKTTCHFLLLLVGFDTLTYRKELQLIPYTCGSSPGTWRSWQRWRWILASPPGLQSLPRFRPWAAHEERLQQYVSSASPTTLQQRY